MTEQAKTKNWDTVTARDGSRAYRSADKTVIKVVWRDKGRRDMCMRHIQSGDDDSVLWDKLAEFVASQPDDMHRAWAQECVANMPQLLQEVADTYCTELDKAAGATVTSTAEPPEPDESAADALLAPKTTPNLFAQAPPKKINLFGGS